MCCANTPPRAGLRRWTRSLNAMVNGSLVAGVAHTAIEIRAVADNKYSKYLTSKDWKKKRQQALAHYGSSCVLCDSDTGLNVHHRTYNRIYDESMSDLIVLCRDCHAAHHKKLTKQTLKTSQATTTPQLFLNLPVEIAQLPLRISAKLVFGALKMHCRHRDVCRVQWATLQADTGLSRSSISRALKELRTERLVANLRTGRSSYYVIYPPRAKDN